MSTRTKTAVAVTAAALALSVGGSVAAMAATNSPQQPTARTSARAAAAGPIDTSTEAKYTAITPCRIVDTRLAGGPITNGSPRSFVAASGSSLAAQGGSSAGCGVPDAAVAIQANVVAVGGAGSGYLKVYPFGAAAPLASYLNFRDGKAIANGGAITLDTTGAKHFTVSASRSTQVVVDVSGYFIKPLSALVDLNATLLHGSRVASVAPVGTVGSYEVVFDRDVSKCSYAVTPFSPDRIGLALPWTQDANGVFVSFRDANRDFVDSRFYLTVTC